MARARAKAMTRYRLMRDPPEKSGMERGTDTPRAFLNRRVTRKHRRNRGTRVALAHHEDCAVWSGGYNRRGPGFRGRLRNGGYLSELRREAPRGFLLAVRSGGGRFPSALAVSDLGLPGKRPQSGFQA